ncbi:MAG: hypothetical protein EOM76_11760 [Sphingobacteriia bacterium]|nr:hypothetical protein [Sphingobacteriia bacterium]
MEFIRDNDKTSHNIETAYNNGKYIVAYKNIYQPFYNANGGCYAHSVYHSDNGNLTLKGRFFHYTGDQVNDLLGIKLLNNL